MATLWHNGKWIDSAEAGIDWSDRGLLHGLGLFETLLAVDGQPVHLDRHLGRLSTGLKRLGWKMPEYDLKAAMTGLLERNGLQNGRARLRLSLTAGSGKLDELTMGKNGSSWISATPLDVGTQSLKLGLSPWRRNEHSALAGLKCASYADNLIALDWAHGQNFNEVIFLNTAGDVCEAATANLFLVKAGQLLTPSLDSGCLAGVARELLLELAGESARQMRLGLEDIEVADECFLSSATRGVIPVNRFGEKKFPSGKLTAQLADQWEALL